MELLTFILVSIGVLVVPGPTVMVVVSTSITHGRNRGLQTVAGSSHIYLPVNGDSSDIYKGIIEMKEPGLGHSATGVFFGGIILTVLISIFMNRGGWGGSSWFIGVILIGFSASSLLAAVLGIIGISRDEDPTIGTGCSITTAIMIVILVAIFYFGG